MASETATDKRAGPEDRLARMEEVVVEHQTALLRYAERILRNTSDAQDVVQNVFRRLFKGWNAGFQPDERLRGWLFKVTHNEAVDLIRKESRRRELHEKQAQEQPESCADGIHCEAPDEERRQAVLAQIGKLHAREQQVLFLRFEEGLSYSEIAGITGRSEGNVGNILHHAIQKLADKVNVRKAAG